jgi:protein-disulfide isomerase
MLLTRFRLTALALPLALGLAACGGEPAAPGAASTETAEPIAKIAAPAGQAWVDTIAKTPEGGYRMGNPEAPIKLIEFASLTCGACANFAANAFESIRDEYVASGRVSFEVRNFVRDPIDVTAAMLTRCGAPESYFPLTEQVFANQPAIFERVQAGTAQAEAAAALPEDQRFVALAQAFGLTDFFAARGISADQAKACLAKGAAATELANATNAQAAQYKITGTPTFLINGANAEVSTWEELEPILQRMGAR